MLMIDETISDKAEFFIFVHEGMPEEWMRQLCEAGCPLACPYNAMQRNDQYKEIGRDEIATMLMRGFDADQKRRAEWKRKPWER